MTAYSPDYCKLLMRHMESGMSFESFAGTLRVGKSTIKKWLSTHEDFAEAKDIGDSLLLQYWEKLGIAGTCGKMKGFSAPTYKLIVQKHFKGDYEEKQTIEHVGNDHSPVVIYQLPDNGRDRQNGSGAGTDNI